MSDALLREALDNFRIYGDLRRDEVLHGLDGVVNREVASWHRGFIKALDEAQEWWREHAPATPPASAERAAVVEAAKAWVEKDIWYDLNGLNAIAAAVDALRAAEARDE
jgi:hypothetical protein